MVKKIVNLMQQAQDSLRHEHGIEPKPAFQERGVIVFKNEGLAKKGKRKLQVNGLSEHAVFERQGKMVFVRPIILPRQDSQFTFLIEELAKKGLRAIQVIEKDDVAYISFSKQDLKRAYEEIKTIKLPIGFHQVKMTKKSVILKSDKPQDKKKKEIGEYDSFEIWEMLKKKGVFEGWFENPPVIEAPYFDEFIDTAVPFLKRLKHQYKIILVAGFEPAKFKDGQIRAKSVGKNKLDDCIVEFISSKESLETKNPTRLKDYDPYILFKELKVRGVDESWLRSLTINKAEQSLPNSTKLLVEFIDHLKSCEIKCVLQDDPIKRHKSKYVAKEISKKRLKEIISDFYG